MRVSTRVEYGVQALAYIALYSENGTSVSTPEIAETQGISKKYLEQILPLLRQAGLIRAQKGLGGGYTLARQANGIRIADILNALDNSVLEDPAASGEKEGNELKNAIDECLWGRINRLLGGFAAENTLADLLRECRNRMANEYDMYVI